MMLTIPWLIPLIPAAAFVIILFFGTRMPRRGAELGVGSMVTSVVLSLWLAVEWINSDRVPRETQHTWFQIGDVTVAAGTLTDGLTAVMLVLVAVVSLLVQWYSTNYMKDDRRYTHFYAILTFFTAAMQWFVMSSNTLQMIFGWEVMALCSFLLIGHWWEEKSNVHAAMKAFLTTRASDIGLFVGVAILFFGAGSSFDIPTLNDAALAGRISEGLLLAGAVALFIAVIGKSAQFPLHTWLPDAMAGPTPMSALIHAATMVVAGVYLLARLFPVFAEAFEIGPGGGANVIAIIGAITIVIAALLAFVQRDIKKVLSYSTVSQLGYMVMAFGVGAWTAGVFHLFTHGFFKALLFLAAGSVSHVVHGFDLDDDMGGLRKPMPVTHATFAIGSAALVGIIPLSGFWSKEQITAQAGANGYEIFQVVALLGTLLTAAYMTRCYYLMFWGRHRGSSHPHESPWTITAPCVILAALSVVVGFLQAPLLHLDFFREWVTPSYVSELPDETAFTFGLTAEVVLAVIGIAVAMLAYAKGVGPRSIAQRYAVARGLYHLLWNRYYLDWLYERVVVQGIKRGLSWLVHWVDHNVVDSFVDLVGRTTVGLGRFVDRRVDLGAVDRVVNGSGAVAEGSGSLLSRVQSGHVQRYAAMMLAAVTVVAVILVAGK